MWIIIDKTLSTSLSRQIYSQIKIMILDGKLSEGEKLPSSRQLSKELSLSRNTVLEAYDQLIAEGYLNSNTGSGTFVANGLSKYEFINFSQNNISSSKETLTKSNIIDFRSGIPDLSLFPKKHFGNLYKSLCNNLSEIDFLYQSSSGVMDLRIEIANYLLRARGLNCNPENIMIVSGATQGLDLVSKLLYKNSNVVLMENPTHKGLKNVISKNGYSITNIDVDDYGLNTDLLKASNKVSFIYTTPSHQYPLGGILPIQRRLDLIQYSISNNCYIVEDDYDSEFRYEGQPINSLYELNPNKVIYIGSFSKILAPSLRLGYLILPNELISHYLKLKQYSDVHTESLSQFVLAKFINSRELEKHILKMKRVYSKKRSYLINELSKYFPNQFEIKGHSSGLHIIIKFYNISFTKEVINQALLNNVKIYPISDFEVSNKEIFKNQALFGYSHLSFQEISKGIKLLNQSIQELL